MQFKEIHAVLILSCKVHVWFGKHMDPKVFLLKTIFLTLEMVSCHCFLIEHVTDGNKNYNYLKDHVKSA